EARETHSRDANATTCRNEPEGRLVTQVIISPRFTLRPQPWHGCPHPCGGDMNVARTCALFYLGLRSSNQTWFWGRWALTRRLNRTVDGPEMCIFRRSRASA